MNPFSGFIAFCAIVNPTSGFATSANADNGPTGSPRKRGLPCYRSHALRSERPWPVKHSHGRQAVSVPLGFDLARVAGLLAQSALARSDTLESTDVGSRENPAA